MFSAAALGTQKLLHKLKGEGDLPRISDRLGVLTRTNSEAILGALAPDLSIDYTEGVAITSSWHPDEHTHIEPVRYGRGSNFMSMMQTVLADDAGTEPRWRTWMREMWSQRKHVIDLYDMKHWSERTVIALVMQTLDNSITTIGKKTPFGWRMSLEAGPRRAEPDVHPDRLRGGTPDGRRHGRHPRRRRRRAVQRAADRPLHRRLHDRRLPRDGRGRPLPADVRPPRAAHRDGSRSRPTSA